MSRKPRNLQPGYSYHITTRCNNREFKLSRRECREVFLYAIRKALEKYGFKLYALCIMSNHVHYLLEPTCPEDLPKIMHFLNWYTAMWFNRMLNRTGHFWEKRYYADGFAPEDIDRALYTLRYIHANPKAAKMLSGIQLRNLTPPPAPLSLIRRGEGGEVHLYFIQLKIPIQRILPSLQTPDQTPS